MALFTIEWVGSIAGCDKYRTQRYPEGGTSQTFKKGTPVQFDASDDGIIQVDVSSGAPAAAEFLGLALEDATGTADTELDVLIPTAGDIFSAMLASDQDTLVAPTNARIGEISAGLLKITSTATNNAGQAAAGTEWVVDTSETNIGVKIIGFDPRDLQLRNVTSLGDPTNLVAGDRVLFTFLSGTLDKVGAQS